MDRRRFLATVGVGAASGFAGCTSNSGSGQVDTGAPQDGDGTPESGSASFEHPGTLEETFVANGDYPSDDSPADGYPPEFPDPPASPDADESSFATTSTNGESVKLAPIDVVEKWYRRGEARFVDARGLRQYKRSHVYGGVLSTAQKNSDGGGIDGWPAEDHIVTYCGCPHHLSSLRAAGLQKAGYKNVFAIDEGFGEWSDRDYPMAGTAFGTETQGDVSEWTIQGVVDDRFAGEYAWAEADRQYEAAPIQGDGSFMLHLKFSAVTSETPVRVSTPAFSVTRPLGDLVAGVVQG